MVYCVHLAMRDYMQSQAKIHTYYAESHSDLSKGPVMAVVVTL